MNKKEFLLQLNNCLKGLPTEEKKDIIKDFDEYFTNGIEDGKTEEEIAESLGSPQQIAKDTIATYHLNKLETTTTLGNIMRAVWATIGLGLFNIIIVLGPFIGLVAIILAGWFSGIAFAASPLLLLVDLVIFRATLELFNVFVSVAFCGLGLLILVAMYYLTRVFAIGFVRYLQFNVKLVKGGLKYD